ncbi:flavin reductase family protein [Pelagicoccus sp. SDUM812003]|uniref:flavin reductase family protein n=1 Tax=Pelagicoccus sp. SDUM812003 TaxID=3041267 RepID=UPI00280F1622|nr:flavin reductase family protein [Pelagicoccus sp. SDUM812003]MDQ8205617.1 flavin reductase family protein [Pelagicoccus sp. SDUM812003]
MEIDLPSLAPAERYKLLTSLVVPRPIAWVTTLGQSGALNAAPFSFFNVFGSKPPLVVLGIGNRPDTGEPKDTVLNIRATGEFVVNLANRSTAEKMVATSASHPREVDELKIVGLETAPSQSVAPPRIALAPAALECETHSIQEIGGNRLIVGLVKRVYVADEFIDPSSQRVLTEKMDIIGRMHGPDGYISYQGLFSIERPS